jgi:hypothetical protein
MLDFVKLTLNDIEKVRAYFPYSTNRICDNTVGGAFMWRDYFSVEYAEFNDTLIFKAQVKYHYNKTAFSMPLGKDINGSLQEVTEYCRNREIPVIFYTVTNEDIGILRAFFNTVNVIKEDDWSDYLYWASDLKELPGRKYHGQKNHINFFYKTHTHFSFEEITKANIAEVIDFYKNYGLKAVTDSDVFLEEHYKTLEVLENYDIYGLLGGFLRIDGAVEAFSIGEICNDVLFIHIEKANLKLRGAYQVVNNEFARYYALKENVEYINREEDIGDEGLRISKKSYHPCEIVQKYIAEIIHN